MNARSEDAPVNTGASIVWPDSDTAYFRVRKMQTKLHQWAKEDSSRRFDDVFNLVYDPAFLVDAFERTARNKGARTAGVDGVTVHMVRSRIGRDAFLQQVRDLLKSGEFRPSEVRRVAIPKAGGKLRKLGIPTVIDRVVQASLKAVLEPVFEADFLPCSYGFRPNRRAQDAIAEIHSLASPVKNHHWVLEADIKACFDEIDHTSLMDRVRGRVKDKRTNALVKSFLKSGVMTQSGNREETITGTPQGGILSPLLANIALSALDEYIAAQWETSAYRRRVRRQKGIGNWKLVRYADDFVIMVQGSRDRAEVLKEEVSQVLTPLGLRLAEEKTGVVHIDQGFDFLGFHIRRRVKRGTRRRYVYTIPSKKSVQAIKDGVRRATNRPTRNTATERKIAEVDTMVRGWANYFRHGVSKKMFSTVDSFSWWRLSSWIRRKHSNIGLRELRRRFTDRGWRLAYQGSVFRGASNVTVSRYRFRGYSIPTPWTTRPATC
ncbi:group II intron reverse transcriptase/maturase [Nocardiopsis metallicus]|uniref:RNA-directed DNA polymerase n=1 Tax=Nocardiopsis metallicus TaxID=179819 RepID=A0A840WG46_9ACTN|nr:group II intron reverse transcriptase/maturase [Nocardiopsis metallicus]MBB5489470.1 RNA-directed DNA polymerase [Nocardiopsis metallicus]MBB5490942.1 RNA-directed DNA polymerase [Nocardiopsis metallicus]MBB5491523.1 RNA-directed DNA polymerase [Nocardiopsis metallicus]MBB5491574.1 RNA-directed DNA polymerase [Nocardiopsis metallicus]MBB5491981.1 RNA-directed DNA polymerase [Nocardiopsis metallicus]